MAQPQQALANISVLVPSASAPPEHTEPEGRHKSGLDSLGPYSLCKTTLRPSINHNATPKTWSLPQLRGLGVQKFGNISPLHQVTLLPHCFATIRTPKKG